MLTKACYGNGAQGRHAIHIHTFGDFSEGFTGAGQSWQTTSTTVRDPGLLVVGVVVAQLQRSPDLPCPAVDYRRHLQPFWQGSRRPGR